MQIENGKAGAVAFESVAAFAFARDAPVEVPGAGRVTLDVGSGGAFYAVLPAARFNLDVRASPTRALVDAATNTAVIPAKALGDLHISIWPSPASSIVRASTSSA